MPLPWTPPRAFTLSVGVLYGVLTIVACVLFARKLLRLRQQRSDEERARLLSPDPALAAGPIQIRSGQATIEDSGYGAVSNRGVAQAAQDSTAAPGASTNGHANDDDDNDDDEYSDEEEYDCDATEGTLTSAMSPEPTSSQFAPPPQQAVRGSEVFAERGSIKSDPRSSAAAAFAAGLTAGPRAAKKEETGCACSSCECLPTCCGARIVRTLQHCFLTAICAPATYFAERHVSTVLLLGTLAIYNASRAVTITYMAASDWAWAEIITEGAKSMLEVLLGAPPALALTVLQHCILLKWVTNVRAISAASGGGLNFCGGGGVQDSKKTRGCNVDIGSPALFSGVVGIVFTAGVLVVEVLAYHAGLRTGERQAQPNSTVTYLGQTHVFYQELQALTNGGCFILNGLWTVALGVILRVVWKPFSDVALTASRTMFVVALVWGCMYIVRGVLLFSYAIHGFNSADVEAAARTDVQTNAQPQDLVDPEVSRFFGNNRRRSAADGSNDAGGGEPVRTSSSQNSRPTRSQDIGLPIVSRWPSVHGNSSSTNHFVDANSTHLFGNDT